MDPEADPSSAVGRRLASDFGLLLTGSETEFLARTQGIASTADLDGFTPRDIEGVAGLDYAAGLRRHSRWKEEVRQQVQLAVQGWDALRYDRQACAADVASAQQRATRVRKRVDARIAIWQGGADPSVDGPNAQLQHLVVHSAATKRVLGNIAEMVRTLEEVPLVDAAGQLLRAEFEKPFQTGSGKTAIEARRRASQQATI